jgi:hypothetical protein
MLPEVCIYYIWKLSLGTNKSIAYTIYAFFEWALVLLDVAFDAVTISEFKDCEIVVKDNRGLSRGYVRLPS